METLYEIREETLVIYMPTDLDHHNASLITEHTDWYITCNNVKNILFDFKNTDFMDSSGIGVVMGRFKLIKKFGGKVEVTNINSVIDRIFTISGLYKIVEKADNYRLENV